MKARIGGIVILAVLVSAFLLRWHGRPKDLDTSPPIPSRPGRPAQPVPGLKAGDQAPSFELADLTGKKIALKKLTADKPVLLWVFSPT